MEFIWPNTYWGLFQNRDHRVEELGGVGVAVVRWLPAHPVRSPRDHRGVVFLGPAAVLDGIPRKPLGSL